MAVSGREISNRPNLLNDRVRLSAEYIVPMVTPVYLEGTLTYDVGDDPTITIMSNKPNRFDGLGEYSISTLPGFTSYQHNYILIYGSGRDDIDGLWYVMSYDGATKTLTLELQNDEPFGSFNDSVRFIYLPEGAYILPNVTSFDSGNVSFDEDTWDAIGSSPITETKNANASTSLDVYVESPMDIAYSLGYYGVSVGNYNMKNGYHFSLVVFIYSKNNYLVGYDALIDVSISNISKPVAAGDYYKFTVDGKAKYAISGSIH